VNELISGTIDAIVAMWVVLAVVITGTIIVPLALSLLWKAL
jgi:hypothetical protein